MFGHQLKNKQKRNSKQEKNLSMTPNTIEMKMKEILDQFMYIMDRLIKFCLPLEMQNWLNQYKAPGYEYAFAKDIPNTIENHKMTNRLAKIVPLRRKYRGSSKENYRRPSAFCHKKFADRFALYHR